MILAQYHQDLDEKEREGVGQHFKLWSEENQFLSFSIIKLSGFAPRGFADFPPYGHDSQPTS